MCNIILGTFFAEVERGTETQMFLARELMTPVNGTQERAVRGFDSKDQGKSVNDEICKWGEKESSSRE
jgi:hypothetical protein